MAAIERAPGLERPGALGCSVPRRMRYTPYTPPQRETALSHPCPGKPGLRPYSWGRIISRRTAGALNKPRLRAAAPAGGLVDIPPFGCGLTRRRFLPPLSSSLPLTIRRATSRRERKTVSRSTAPAGPLPGIIHRPPLHPQRAGATPHQRSSYAGTGTDFWDSAYCAYPIPQTKLYQPGCVFTETYGFPSGW